MYKNLEAEMVRKDISRKDLAELLGVRYQSIHNKLNGKSAFSFDQALKIKKTFFPKIQLELLFEKYETQQTA